MAQRITPVGIDVSQARLDVFIQPSRRRLQYSNDEAGWQLLLAELAPLEGVIVGFEASGGYEKGLGRALDEAGLAFRCLDALKVSLFRRAGGKRAKNDRIDAAAIADYLVAFPAEPDRLDPQAERLAEAVRYRQGLVEEQQSIANRGRLLAAPELQAKNRQRLAQVKLDIAWIDRHILALLKADQALLGKAAVLTSVKGVGITFAATLLGLLPELGTLHRRAIAALVGICPYDHDSGKLAGKRCIAGGRAPLRNAFYMPTLSAIRANSVIKAYYEKLRANGKVAKVAIVACMRKLATILNAKLRDFIASSANQKTPMAA